MMSMRRPFASEERKEDGEKRALPLPTVRLQTVDRDSPVPQVQAGKLAEASASEDIVSKGLKNLESLLRALGFDGAFSERVSARLAEIDREIKNIENEVAKLEEQKRKLLREREKILSVVRAFAGVEQ